LELIFGWFGGYFVRIRRECKSGDFIGKQCPKSLKRKDKEKALISQTNQSFMPLSFQDEVQLVVPRLNMSKIFFKNFRQGFGMNLPIHK
jgi:hypothetical protein